MTSSLMIAYCDRIMLPAVTPLLFSKQSWHIVLVPGGKLCNRQVYLLACCDVEAWFNLLAVIFSLLALMLTLALAMLGPTVTS